MRRLVEMTFLIYGAILIYRGEIIPGLLVVLCSLVMEATRALERIGDSSEALIAVLAAVTAVASRVGAPVRVTVVEDQPAEKPH